jgi:hypothetical protein
MKVESTQRHSYILTMCACFSLLYRCTLWYRAPELLMCESVYSHKIDEWSVGCVLLEMVIGVPPFRGKPECRCQCPQVTHKNFNSDQLARIFVVTGSPSDKMVMRVPCQVHIRGWPKAPRKLEHTVKKMLTVDRFCLGGTSAHSVPQAEMDNAIGTWSSVIAAMLELDPVSRWTCSQAYEVLNRMVVANKRSPQERESMANVNNDSPTSAPGGPQSASPSFEAGRILDSESDSEMMDTSPPVLRSPEHGLPGHNMSLCSRLFNDSKNTRLAEGNRKQAVCGTGLVTGQAHEQTLQPRTGGQPRLKSDSEPKNHVRGHAPSGFERTKFRSDSLSPGSDDGNQKDNMRPATAAPRRPYSDKRIALSESARKDREKEGAHSDCTEREGNGRLEQRCRSRLEYHRRSLQPEMQSRSSLSAVGQSRSSNSPVAVRGLLHLRGSEKQTLHRTCETFNAKRKVPLKTTECPLP